MRGKGITYDTGFLSAGSSTHEPFDPEVVRREMRIIRDDLHFDMASFGVVKVLDGESGSGHRRYPDMPWEPKIAFTTLAEYYGR